MVQNFYSCEKHLVCQSHASMLQTEKRLNEFVSLLLEEQKDMLIGCFQLLSRQIFANPQKHNLDKQIHYLSRFEHQNASGYINCCSGRFCTEDLKKNCDIEADYSSITFVAFCKGIERMFCADNLSKLYSVQREEISVSLNDKYLGLTSQKETQFWLKRQSEYLGTLQIK